MVDRSQGISPDEPGLTEAVAWIVRVDRGLSPVEQKEFDRWLADPAHREIFEARRREWRQLDQLAAFRPSRHSRPNRHLLRPARRPLRWAAVGLAAAAVLAVTAVWFSPASPGPRTMQSIAAGDDAGIQHQLEDGSRVELNRGAVVMIDFRPDERRIVLQRGEAIFFVARDPQRPFVVVAGKVEARAVGTAFTVKLASDAVEVLVTEGKVVLARRPAGPAGLAAVPKPSLNEPLGTSQRAVLPPETAEGSVHVETLTVAEMQRFLAWQHRLLDFTNEPLANVVIEFNRRNGVQLVLAEPALGALRVNASIRSDNLEAFVHLLADGFALAADRADERRIVLRQRP